MRAFWVALQFLTRAPVPRLAAPSASECGRSVLYYPLVGLLIGALLVGAAFAFANVDPVLAAALILVMWVVLTGGLHLDGFADTVDAWAGGQGDRDKTLAIMKDPRRGAAAIVGVMLLLLVKYAALIVLLRIGEWSALLVAPVVARTALVFLFLTTPYVRADGIGAAHATHLPRRSAIVVLVAALGAIVLADFAMVVPLIAAAAIVFGLRQMMRRCLGGATGDTLGATCEIVEASVLVVAALAFGHIDG